jgi:hypothetical protein
LREKKESRQFLEVERKAVLTLIMTTKMIDLNANEFHLMREVSLGVFYLQTV